MGRHRGLGGGSRGAAGFVMLRTKGCTHTVHMPRPSRTLCLPQLEPADVIIVEGILVLHMPEVRDLLHMKV